MVTRRSTCTLSSNRCSTKTIGPWQNITGGYLGLKFVIHGKVLYGWARLNVTVTDRGVFGLLTGYAYETVANKAILAGKTKGDEDDIGMGPADFNNHSPDAGTLSQLAQGAAGLNGTLRQAKGTRQ